MKNIVLDIDDVTLSYASALVSYLNKGFGKSFQKRQIKSFDLSLYYPLDKKSLSRGWEEFSRTEKYSNLRLINQAGDGINQISDLGKIYFVTCRQEELRKETEKNLRKVPEVWEDLIFTNGFCKGEIYKKINPFLVIDDNVNNFLESQRQGIDSLLFNQPWNQCIDVEEKRMRNWNEILEYLKKY